MGRVLLLHTNYMIERTKMVQLQAHLIIVYTIGPISVYEVPLAWGNDYCFDESGINIFFFQ